MKRIQIKTIRLVNFKGVANLTVNFDPQETNIIGDNGTGKTTIFDAFTWVLFGKDSEDRKEFEIKTTDKSGNYIPRIPHEVTAILQVDDAEVTLRKVYSEKWTRPRNQVEEVFSGHQVECFVNDVPCTVSEYNAQIADICDEQVFKLITNPLYFPTQKEQFQRQMLFEITGNISYQDVAIRRPEFAELVSELSGKTLEGYKREIQAKKRQIKQEVETIPTRIDERRRSMPKAQDWESLEAMVANGEKIVAEIDEQLADTGKAYEAASSAKQELIRKRSDLKNQKFSREQELERELLTNYNLELTKHNDYVQNVEDFKRNRSNIVSKKEECERNITSYETKRMNLLQEWKNISAEEFVNNDEFICPTCHRRLEEDDINSRLDTMRANFNQDKALRLDYNKRSGIANNESLKAEQERLKRHEEEIFNLDAEIAKMENSTIYKTTPVKPDVAPSIASDETLIKWTKEIEDLTAQINEEIKVPDTTELRNKRKSEQEAINSVKALLGERQYIAESEKRISELEQELRTNQEKLSELEAIEFNILQFSKARVEEIEDVVNSLFTIVRFKMFETQVNGEEVETCEAMVDGVPFSNLNNGKKINAGLDIINAICKAKNIQAPIFIDNREGVTKIIPVLSQVVNLIVDRNQPTLKID